MGIVQALLRGILGVQTTTHDIYIYILLFPTNPQYDYYLDFKILHDLPDFRSSQGLRHLGVLQDTWYQQTLNPKP